jgi:hypothetical protein
VPRAGYRAGLFFLFDKSKWGESPPPGFSLVWLLNSHKGYKGFVDAGPTGLPSNMPTSRGPWPNPRIEAGRGATTDTPNPSRIEQNSRTPTEKYLLYLDQDTFFGSD